MTPKIIIDYLHIIKKIEPNSTVEISLQNPIDVNMFSVDIITSENSIGDSYDVHVNKNTLVGGITQNSTTKILHCTPTVVEKVEKPIHR